ncbi:unnamed protein product [Oncorhynchus mykiss]|uniref:Uncharacterized protein n=1 Tax=Oncorhynchus mykiss TaxID=8022 RepID=A0A060WV62_ONCMY|nr:unnamed protein product [Oncorhynchus mykiss]
MQSLFSIFMVLHVYRHVRMEKRLSYGVTQRFVWTNKIIFGTGTKVIVNSREKHDPSYYSLKSRNTTACLATDFSAHNATTHLELFNKTEATRMNGDSYYSQVALGGENCTEVGGSEKCEANWYFDTDAKINFLSLTILGLRILFLKTIVFNVLITLRLWMS